MSNSPNLYDCLNYTSQKLGTDLGGSRSVISFVFGGFVSGLSSAAECLSERYDLGISLARDGVPIGYFFHNAGLPVKVVDVKRRGFGATWKPIDEIVEDEINGKRVLVIDNDVVTGRSVRKASQELRKYDPKELDLFVLMKEPPMSLSWYIKHYKGKKCPQILYICLDDCLIHEIANKNTTNENITNDYDHRSMVTYDSKSGVLKIKENEFSNRSKYSVKVTNIKIEKGRLIMEFAQDHTSNLIVTGISVTGSFETCEKESYKMIIPPSREKMVCVKTYALVEGYFAKIWGPNDFKK